MLPAGPEEAQDWVQTLDRDANNISTRERHQRKLAEVMATNQESLAVLETKFEASVIYGETTRAYFAEACENMQKRFVKVEEDGNRGDEAHREDMSS